MKIRINNYINESYVDGPGIRFSVFTQGCPHHCKGCHNPQTHDFSLGKEIETDIRLKIGGIKMSTKNVKKPSIRRNYFIRW